MIPLAAKDRPKGRVGRKRTVFEQILIGLRYESGEVVKSETQKSPTDPSDQGPRVKHNVTDTPLTLSEGAP